MSEEKLLGGQRYFISKILEYFNPQQSPMFYKALQEKRYDSLLLMFQEFLEIEKDIREGTSDKSKLNNSLNSSLKSILFHCENNPWAKEGQLARDINYLVGKIQLYFKEQNEYLLNVIHKSISSLAKRCKPEDLINDYINLILGTPFSFKDIDLLVQYFISELINLGYSLKYLGEWKQKNPIFNSNTRSLDKEALHNRLLTFKELITQREGFTIIVNSWLPDELKHELLQEEFIYIIHKYCKISEEEEAIVEAKIKKLNYPKADQYQNLRVEINAHDKYKAIEQVVKNLEGYLEMYKYVFDFDKKAVNINCLLKTDDEWVQMRTDDTDTYFFNKNMNERENEDIKDFLSLRNKARKEEMVNNTNVQLLNNALEMLKNSIKASPENRLLNNWSSLEYILNSYEGKSIISKIIDIVPKVICMYLVKDRLNSLWEKIIKLKNSKIYNEVPIIEELLLKCSKEGEKYEKTALIDFLSEEKNIKSLYDNVSQDVILSREIAFVRDLLTNTNKIAEHIETLHQVIEHDLTRIYRVRNKLVHSGNNIFFNIDILTVRLNKYVNSLIGTLIHYLKRQPDLQISEVLNSIHETYNWYVNYLKTAKSKDKETAVFPPYLYL
ncbi:hypothetical protein A499_04048 [Niallia nealsonii AAU1]|nr:hypothetical protein A499_04048 [Niallia nealsonii AAU1]